jgi:hypothetical protein
VDTVWIEWRAGFGRPHFNSFAVAAGCSAALSSTVDTADGGEDVVRIGGPPRVISAKENKVLAQ